MGLSDLAGQLLGGAGQQGGNAAVLNTLQIPYEKRPTESVLCEFQRRGFFLTHVLECAHDAELQSVDLTQALKQRIPSVTRRLRTSLRPKKVFVISKEMAALKADLKAAQIGAEIVLDGGAPFDLEDAGSVTRLRSVL